jgi:sporulation protein YlmC with PRC-barrel domain
MMMKTVAAGLAGSLLLASAAFAAETSTTTSTTAAKTGDTTAASYQGDWRASKLVGLKVYNDNNESVGSINDMLVDKSGNIKAVVIGVGGFLGMGEHLVAVSFDKTTTGSTATTSSSTSTASSKSSRWYPDHAVFNTTKDELKAMPEFKFSE